MFMLIFSLGTTATAGTGLDRCAPVGFNPTDLQEETAVAARGARGRLRQVPCDSLSSRARGLMEAAQGHAACVRACMRARAPLGASGA